MNDAVYRIVEHDGGWAYKLGDVFSETFPSRQAAESAAIRVAQEQQVPGDDEAISWEDESGTWHDEAARGTDRPHAYVAGAEMARPSPRQTLRTERDGVVRGAADNTFAAYDARAGYAGNGLRMARDQVRSGPLVVMLLAMACGLILGLLQRHES